MAEATHEEPIGGLPRAPRTGRRVTIMLMALTFLAAIGLSLSVWHEARYALSPSQPLDLGSLGGAKLGSEQADRYVRAQIELDASRAVSYRRVAEDGEYQLAPVKGVTGATRWVQYRVPAELRGPRFLPPRIVAGRLARAQDLGWRYRGVVDALRHSGVEEPAKAWVLIDGAIPSRSRWLLGLIGLLGAFALWSLVGLFRLLRPLTNSASAQT